ncbi:MAG: hypothetical protein SGJ15_02900 [Bacteroidota bacterium]|nr:hypothetical protein [Bacteroidota bacterium]
MGSHNDHNDHSNEKKPVSFTVPLIFASVIVFVIVLLVSIGDPKHGECCCEEGKCSKECMDACKSGTCEMACCAKSEEHGGHHGDAHATEAHDHTGSADSATVSTPRHEATDTTSAKAEHKEEAHH